MKAEQHRFAEQTFTKPTFCGHCKQLLWGLRNQGLQCQVCGMTAHRKRCDAILQQAGCRAAAAATKKDVELILSASADDLSSSTSGAAGHDFVVTTFTAPTFCAVCNAFLWGLAKQGLRCSCCRRAVHKRCRRRAARLECGDVEAGNSSIAGDEKKVVLDNELIETLRSEGHSAGQVVECMYALLDAGVPVTRAAVEQCLRARAERGEVSEDGEPEDGDEDMCCICLERPRNALVMPCKHLCLCSMCAAVDACPICRTPAHDVITGIFL